MSIRKENALYNPSSQIIKNHNQVCFTNHQSSIKRVASLKKVESVSPSFTPKINQIPFEIYPERTKTQMSKQQIIQRLLDDRHEKAQSLRAEKIKYEEEKCSYQCTFQPSINLHSKKLSNREQDSKKQTHQRLYEQGLTKMKTMNECTHIQTDQDKENCTFQPNISKDRPKDKFALLPIYDRIQKIITEKKQYLKRLQGEVYENETKQKPEINFKSNQILQKKADFKKNVLQRLFNHIKQKNNRLQRLAQDRKEEIEKECVFQPEINFRAEDAEEGDFLERQEREAQKMKQKLIYLKEREQAPFKPSINKLSALLVEAQRIGQSQEQKIQRLHCEPFLERKAQIQKIEQQIYRECTFQPQINPLSKGINIVPHSHKCACHPKQEHFHFHPQINPKSRQLAQKMKPKQEGLAVQHARLQLEYKQMKECTFKPKTLGDNYKSALQKKSVKEIPGANSYQLRIQKVKARKKEEQMLKQKLFSIQKRYVQHRKTQPQPFNLSSGQQKIPKLKQKAEQEFRKVYTFRPQICARIR